MEGLSQYEKEDRPWGGFERFTLNEPTTVKIITVQPHEAFSLQTHAHRAEFWRIISGNATITIGEETRSVEAGSTVFISQGEKHRLEAGDAACSFLEIAFGAFEEGDIVRIQDKYGRA